MGVLMTPICYQMDEGLLGVGICHLSCTQVHLSVDDCNQLNIRNVMRIRDIGHKETYHRVAFLIITCAAVAYLFPSLTILTWCASCCSLLHHQSLIPLSSLCNVLTAPKTQQLARRAQLIINSGRSFIAETPEINDRGRNLFCCNSICLAKRN